MNGCSRSTYFPVALAWLVASCPSLVAADGPDFEHEVAPVLVNHCLDCHHRNKRSGKLDVSTLAGLVAGGEQGSALTAGNPASSLMMQRVLAGEMPPPEAKESRPLSDAQKQTLSAWIAAGAPWPKDRELGIHEKPVDLDKAREFWSLQPVRRPSVPPMSDAMRAGNPIDAFIGKQLNDAKLVLSPRASSPALLRRVSLDVRGLPPTLEEQDAFLNDRAPDAYERLVDRWLADPAYGERWSRHWLDVVRYADSNGYERDGAKPSVWRYRDYVIAALNADKPYDRFVVEQLAGDELADATSETLIATGFHALGAWQDEVDPLEAAQYRADELDDMVRTTSQTFLGVTLGCARCHNHKFDPLTMVDYYSLVAVLAPLKRPNKGRTDHDLPLGTPEEIAALHQRDEAIALLQRKIADLQKNKPADLEERISELRKEQRELRRRTPDLPAAYRCFEDSGEAPPTYLLLSGRASSPGPAMQPRVPAVLTTVQPAFSNSGQRSTLRRLTLARWIASADNPLTARVIVNRVWQHHFGEGLVATPSDFGQMGARPTHPELLDWLADWFVHDAGWSLKTLHRLILTSETYRQSSILDFGLPILDLDGNGNTSNNPKSKIQNPKSVDPEDRLLWRYPYRRLDVEAIRDSMLAVAGNLNRQMYGPAVYLPIPAAAIEAHTDKQAAWQLSAEPQIARRTVYAFVKRTLLVPMLETLDFCDTTQSTDRRAITSVAPQALTLFNGEFVSRQAEQFAQRLAREADSGINRQIRLAFQLALAREPAADEARAMQQFFEREAAATDRQAALVQVCRVILNLNEFVYPN
jgi:uncharacterized protein DUF1553/uncharacterized protein DUF1549/cytochrome c